MTTVAVLCGSPAPATSAIALSVSPRVANAPVTVTLRVRIVTHPDNRLLVIKSNEGSFYSEIQLDGADTAPLYVRDWRVTEAGDYEVAAFLAGTRGITGVDRVTLTIR